MTNLKEMKLKEVQELAKNTYKITLSYKAENGTRKRYNKEQLISMIEAAQAKENVKVAENGTRTIIVNATVLEPVHYEMVHNSNIKLVHKSEQDNKLNLNTVIKQAKQALSVGNITKVQNYIKELNNNIIKEKTNKLTVGIMSKRVNVLKGMLKQYNGKKQLVHA